MAEHEPSSRPSISRTRLARIAMWSIDLHPDEANHVCIDIVKRTCARDACICPKNALLESWTGVVTGLIRIGTVSPEERSITFMDVPADGWFGEGTVLKGEPRRYDIVALCDACMAFMDHATFMWPVENSVAFSHFLVKQPSERLGHFVTLLEYDRLLGMTPRLARCIVSLFNPVLYPDTGDHLEITQEKLDLPSGMARQVANQSLKALEKDGVVRLGYGDVTVVDLDRLHSYDA